MKKLIPSYFGLLSLSLLSAISEIAVAQDAFEFYFAFEDATGAKDTVWYVMDSEGTDGIDSALGEVLVPLNDTAFMAWAYPINSDSVFKRFVSPFTPFLINGISCLNFVLPITISYDSSLFNSNVLIDVFGSGINYARMENQFLTPPDDDEMFNMLLTNECLLPPFSFGDGYHFPIIVSLFVDYDLSTLESATTINFEIYPNPSSEVLHVKSSSIIYSLNVKNYLGHRIIQLQPNDQNITLDLSTLSAGIYLVEVITEAGRGVQKLVVE